MKKPKVIKAWAVQRIPVVSSMEKHLYDALHEGWEPFSGTDTNIWLRKEVVPLALSKPLKTKPKK